MRSTSMWNAVWTLVYGAAALSSSAALTACSGGREAFESAAGGEPSTLEMQALSAENDAHIRAVVERIEREYARADRRAALDASGFEPPTYESLLAAERERRESVLTPAEEASVRAVFAESDGARPLHIEGRLVQVGDVLYDADELLARSGDTVAKAQICTTDRGGCVGNTGTPFARIDADGSADTMPFRRPDVLNATFMVVADAAPSFFFNALLAETSKIESLDPPGDCLGDNTFVVIRQTAFNQVSATVRAASYAIAASYTAGACDGALGCAGLPSFKNIVVSGGTESRVALGRTSFQINSARLPSDDADLRSTILHELGHVMGRAHPESDGSAGLIPGTSRQLLVQSVMCAPDASCASDDLSDDDILAIETLYSDSPSRSNDGCAYDPNFRVFTPL